MLKIFLFSLSIMMMSGCQNITPKVKTDKKPQVQKQATSQETDKSTKKELTLKKEKQKPQMKKMFQTVDAKDAILVQKGPQKEHCAMCGMNLIKFYKTSHAAKLEGKNIQYCSLHCLTAHINEGAELENPMVVDVRSLKFIPVTEAFYVVGSDVKGTMSPVSKYAFKSLDDAKAFQKKHGGKILDFYSAWQEAKRDFKK
jgi:nitrous oxide reductase accessory protein NosL